MENKKDDKIYKFYYNRKLIGNEKKPHPRFIVDEYSDEYINMVLSHGDKNNTNNNKNYISLEKNPNPHDSRKAYMKKQLRYDKKTTFYKKAKGYKMSDEDIEKVERYTQPRLGNVKRKIDNKKR